MRVASLSVLPAKWDKDANSAKIEILVRKAAAAGAQLIITPEGALEGYVVNEVIGARDPERKVALARRFRALAEPLDGPYARRFIKLADDLNIHLVLGMLELDGEDLFNTVALFGPDGSVVGVYRKTHFAQGYDVNPPGYKPGGAYPVFDVGPMKVGMMICFDRQLPEPARRLALAGAELILCPAYGGWGEFNTWRMRIRAQENQTQVIFTHPQQSLIIDARGALIAHREGSDAILWADLPVRREAGLGPRVNLRTGAK
jgi:deaminated glutathione amidase